MSKNIEHLQHIKSNVVIDGKPKLPTINDLVDGDLAFNYAEGYETISLRNSSSDITTFSSDDYYTKKKLGSGFTGDNSANTVTSVIEENEEIVASALNDLESRKMDASAYTPTDLTNYYTKSETSGATELAAAFDNKADKTAVDDLSGQSETIAAALNDLNNRKLDVSAYTPITSGDIQTQIDESLSSYTYDKSEIDDRTTMLMADTKGHDYVDLGLPSGTLWATMNVGASSETDYGNYYQYGKGAAQYAATSGDSNYSGTEDPLDSSVDTAVQVWGGSWHMPTRAQMQELTANTTYQWVTDYNGSGINGGLFTATNGAVLFLPAAGLWDGGSQVGVGNRGGYCGSSPNGSDYFYYFDFRNDYKGLGSVKRRYLGFSVRGVINGTVSPIKDVVSDIVTSLDGKVGVDEYEADSRAIAIAFNDINNTIGDIETLLAAI